MDDLVSLHLVHSRFRPLFPIATKKHYKVLTVDRKQLQKHPLATSLDRYRALGEICTYLEFSKVTEEAVVAILPWFPHIDTLRLSVPTLKNIEAIKDYPIPKVLELNVKKADKSYLNALLLRFAPRLEELDSKETPNADFVMLTKLIGLEIDAVWLGKKSKFWKNAKHLTRLHMQNEEDRENPYDYEEVFHDFDIVRENLKAIANIESLDYLTWHMIGRRNLRASCVPEFRHPTRINLDFTDHHVILAVIRKLGPQVKEIQMTHLEFAEDRPTMVAMLDVMARNLPDLEVLHLIIIMSFTERQVRPLMALKKLVDLSINISDMSPGFALEMVKAMPALGALSHQVGDSDVAHSPELIAYLTKEDRRMWLGSSECLFCNEKKRFYKCLCLSCRDYPSS